MNLHLSLWLAEGIWEGRQVSAFFSLSFLGVDLLHLTPVKWLDPIWHWDFSPFLGQNVQNGDKARLGPPGGLWGLQRGKQQIVCQETRVSFPCAQNACLYFEWGSLQIDRVYLNLNLFLWYLLCLLLWDSWTGKHSKNHMWHQGWRMLSHSIGNGVRLRPARLTRMVADHIGVICWVDIPNIPKAYVQYNHFKTRWRGIMQVLSRCCVWFGKELGAPIQCFGDWGPFGLE